MLSIKKNGKPIFLQKVLSISLKKHNFAAQNYTKSIKGIHTYTFNTFGILNSNSNSIIRFSIKYKMELEKELR